MLIQHQAIVTGLKMSIAGVMAMGLMITFHLNFGYWAVVTIAAITLQDESATLMKGLMRLVGTIIGASLGYMIALHTYVHNWIGYGLFFITLFCFNIIALQKNNLNYAGVIAGVTAVIIISTEHSKPLLLDIAFYRTCDVILGIIITTAISLFIRSSKLKFVALKHLSSVTINKATVNAAARIALTATGTYVFWHALNIPQGFWITVSCLFIMEESLHNTTHKAWLRFLATVFAAVFGFVAALICGHNVWLLMTILFIGFFCCGYIVGRNNAYSSLGNTMGIALAIMLLSSFYQSDDILHVVGLRLINTCVGIAIGVIMTQYFLPEKIKTAR